MNPKLLYVTVPDKITATNIAKILVDEDLCACVNVLGTIESHYKWEGKQMHSDEVAMLVKTNAEKKTIDRIKKLHPFKCPCIISLDITGGNLDFLEWLKSTKS